ncbi:MAG TPA: pilus assembly protein N-terminal domain-containing protein [Gemmatimonadaceae bacterium]|nr:pilus assembly protein N-terminal domain-containing protein [Gemmatimonadaceae bacterium]
MSGQRLARRSVALSALCAGLFVGVPLAAQQTVANAADTAIMNVDLPLGRSYPISTSSTITQASVANPDVADVVVIGTRDVVINGHGPGVTDVILWQADAPLQHYRISVHSAADEKQVVLAVKFAEVRRNFLRSLGLSGLYRDNHNRVGTGRFNTDNVFDPSGKIVLPSTGVGFGTVLSDFGTSNLLGLLEADEQTGNARILAEPSVMTSNKDSASFLEGGEIPIPVVQNTGSSGVPTITIVWREFGIRLNFAAEVVSDSLVRLHIRPEVSSLDFTNAIEISGFKIPALRTRHVETTVEVRRDQSLIISGLLDDERTKTKDGLPFLKDIPVLGMLFSSTSWQRDETELLVVVTPIVTDPMHPRPQDLMHLAPDTILPARGAIQPRLPAMPKP